MTPKDEAPRQPDEQAARAAESRLCAILSATGPWAIAVSGGVDSVTLATVAHRANLPVPPVMMHAVSPAVPSTARPRLEALARAEGWRFKILSAGELEDPRYRANPYNRCYFCKSNLYGSMLTQLSGQIDGRHLLASGANTDDLGDYRPGLIAAAEAGVRHPLIEAGIGKPLVRAIARLHGLAEVSELPAQPCLASRVETGLRIEPEALTFIDRLETRLREKIGPHETLRVRLRREGVVVELDAALCADPDLARRVARTARESCSPQGHLYAGLQPYRRGSAFVDPMEA